MGVFDFVKNGVREMMIARPDNLKHLIVYKHPDQNFPFWSQLTVDSDAYAGTAATRLADPSTQASKATDYGIGIGWDLSREVRVMLDYDQTKFQGGAANGGNRPDEKVIITRFQYAL